MEKGLSLLTVRHYREGVVEDTLGGRQPLLRQQTPDTVQVVVR
jgi:aspartate kinase